MSNLSEIYVTPMDPNQMCISLRMLRVDGWHISARNKNKIVIYPYYRGFGFEGAEPSLEECKKYLARLTS